MSLLNRQLRPSSQHSFFLFGARNTGKSTLIRVSFAQETSYWVDLFDPELEERYATDPSQLKAEVLALDDNITHVVIDEIQKIPKLLDVVHQLIEQTTKCFILTGSSARKLRHGGANLLAGRAFVYHLYPFTSFELGEQFDLEKALAWGTLPSIELMPGDDDKRQFLQAYARTYLKEEIWVEQFIKKLDPFRKFLEVSAQCNGKIINFSRIANDVGVDEKTIKNYFSILEDTLVGFFLEPFQHSFRKRLSQKPKFYYFDTGVSRTLARILSLPIKPSTSYYGELFEHFVILEVARLIGYYQSEYRLSYLRTRNDVEIDLVVERPGKPILFIEIKSTTSVKEKDIASLEKISAEFDESEAICLSNDKRAKRYNQISVYPWQEGLEKYFIDTE